MVKVLKQYGIPLVLISYSKNLNMLMLKRKDIRILRLHTKLKKKYVLV